MYIEVIPAKTLSRSLVGPGRLGRVGQQCALNRLWWRVYWSPPLCSRAPPRRSVGLAASPECLVLRYVEYLGVGENKGVEL